jgi:hypothetical protein
VSIGDVCRMSVTGDCAIRCITGGETSFSAVVGSVRVWCVVTYFM